MAEFRYMPTRLQAMRAQLYTFGEPCPEFHDYADRHRLDLPTIEAHAGLFAVALAKCIGTDDDAIFEFDPAGIPVAVIEATIFDHERESYVADLVAWPLGAPDAFVTAMGRDAGADVLGAVNMVQRGNAPLVIHPTPMDWLQSGCEGCVLLNERGGAYWLDRAGGPFVVADVEYGRLVRDMLGPRASNHRILVPYPVCEVAA